MGDCYSGNGGAAKKSYHCFKKMDSRKDKRWAAEHAESERQWKERLRHQAATEEATRANAERLARKLRIGKDVCFRCGGLGHHANKCPTGRDTKWGAKARPRQPAATGSAGPSNPRLKHLERLCLTAGQDNPAAIKAAYRRLALATHPDKNPAPEAAELFKAVHAAYEALTVGH